MLDICLALGLPSIRHLQETLTPGEVRLWVRKYQKDQFGAYGQDVRNAVRDANLINVVTGIAGAKRKITADDLMVNFGENPRRVSDWRDMKEALKGWTKAVGGDVIERN